jgi:hypothetical protein
MDSLSGKESSPLSGKESNPGFHVEVNSVCFVDVDAVVVVNAARTSGRVCCDLPGFAAETNVQGHTDSGVLVVPLAVLVLAEAQVPVVVVDGTEGSRMTTQRESRLRPDHWRGGSTD